MSSLRKIEVDPTLQIGKWSRHQSIVKAVAVAEANGRRAAPRATKGTAVVLPAKIAAALPVPAVLVAHPAYSGSLRRTEKTRMRKTRTKKARIEKTRTDLGAEALPVKKLNQPVPATAEVTAAAGRRVRAGAASVKAQAASAKARAGSRKMQAARRVPAASVEAGVASEKAAARAEFWQAKVCLCSDNGLDQ